METDAKIREDRYRHAGASAAAPLATLDPEPGGLVARAGRAVLRWIRAAGLAVAVLYAAGWLALMTGVVVASRQVLPTRLTPDWTSRLIVAEVARPYTLPKTGSMTADEAGATLFRLEPARAGQPTGFTYREVGTHETFPWRETELTEDMFRTARPVVSPGLPASTKVILAARAGFSPKERAVLRAIGAAPLWTSYDAVARAPQVDVLGGRLVVPFTDPDARPGMIPIARFSDTKELAYAGVARAAWHLSEGRQAEAELAIQSVISHGFTLIDNSLFAIDQLIGAVVVGIGRDALQQYFTVVGDPRAATLDRDHADAVRRMELAARRSSYTPPPGTSYIGRRNFARSLAWDATAPRPIVFEHGLRGINEATCGDPREVLLGPAPETRAAYARVGRDLARFESEREVLRLLLEEPSAPLSAGALAEAGVLYRTGDVIGRIYFNPTLGNCVIRVAEALRSGR